MDPRILPKRFQTTGGDLSTPCHPPAELSALSGSAEWAKTPNTSSLLTGRGTSVLTAVGGTELYQPVPYEPNYTYPLLIWLPDPQHPASRLQHVIAQVSRANFVGASPQLSRLGPDAAVANLPPCHWDWLKWSKPNPPLDLPNLEEPEAFSAQEETSAQAESSFAFGESWASSECGWDNWDCSVDAVFEALATAEDHFHVGPNRVFLAGFGCGGTAALRIALAYPGSFAGCISLDGPLPRGQEVLSQWQAVRALPIMLARCEESSYFPCQQALEDLRLCHVAGLSVETLDFQGTHQLTPDMLAAVNRWILRHLPSLRRD